MNDHAKSIWQAWLDEKEVQYYGFHPEYKGNGVCVPTEKWANADPSDPELFTPQECPHRWRIKPEKKTHWFRVYRCLSEEFELTLTAREGPDSNWEAQPFFGGWLTDWISYEVEVEE